MLAEPIINGQSAIPPCSSIGIESSPQKLITRKAAIAKITAFCGIENDIGFILANIMSHDNVKLLLQNKILKKILQDFFAGSRCVFYLAYF